MTLPAHVPDICVIGLQVPVMAVCMVPSDTGAFCPLGNGSEIGRAGAAS